MLLIFIGGIYLIEALSVMIQVASFKRTGKRVFLMAPIHHHFEMKAWSETKIMVRFWIVGAILCASASSSSTATTSASSFDRGPAERVLVLGLARSGRAAIAALRAHGAEPTSSPTTRHRTRRAGLDAEVHLGAWDDELLDGVELVVKSPGVPGDASRSRPPALAASP